ncbi:hypothetical protein [Parafrankia discariae]|uniref:hypothetical protein n=1 Tax=Parafrankia discariae TaxID=365528 RepID=UPI0003733092|nr:hypothetical protein [Parafrankia discariae]
MNPPASWMTPAADSERPTGTSTHDAPSGQTPMVPAQADREGRRRALLALALSPIQDPDQLAAHVAALTPDSPDRMDHWSRLVLAAGAAGAEPRRIVAMALTVGPVLLALVPEPPPFEIDIDHDTVALKIGGAR